jgi:predicted methyltransferase
MRGLFMCLLPVSAMAQVICALGPGAASYQPSQDQRPAGDALQLAARVDAAEKSICGSKCPEIALLRNPTAPNAALIVDSNSGQAKLVYAPQFFAAVYSGYGDAGIIAVIAHEAGHGLDDSMGATWVKSDWMPEVRADAWAGCILAKSNLNANEIQSALGAMEKYPPASHPAWTVRRPAIRTGYSHCGGKAEIAK